MTPIKSTLFVTTLIGLLCISAIAQTNPPAPPGQPAGTNVPPPIHVPSFNGVLGTNQVLFTTINHTPTNGNNTRWELHITNTIPGSNYHIQYTRSLEIPFTTYAGFTATNSTHTWIEVIGNNVLPIRFWRVVSQ